MPLQRTLADSLDALYAGRDSDSGIVDPELLTSCIQELRELAAIPSPFRLRFLDVIWDLSVELYGKEPYTAEDRLQFMEWLCGEADWYAGVSF